MKGKMVALMESFYENCWGLHLS